MISSFHMEPEQLIELDDQASGLRGFIVIHSTALGPAAGGCRLWAYDDDAAALTDARRLAEGMTYKNAMAGLPLGGGKAVIMRPAGDFDRPALFRAFGRAVDRLDGRYVTAEDVGTKVADMQDIAAETGFVAGLAKQAERAGGDPSPWTALGVFEAMKHAVHHAHNCDLRGLTVAVQGVGNVGAGLCALLSEAGAKLIVADVDPHRCKHVSDRLGARIVDVGDVLAVEADIVAPCALGGVLTPAVVGAMSARIICGAANNQLSSPEMAAEIAARGIVYAPDYVANAGGIINVSAEYLGEEACQVRDRVMAIGPRMADILKEADLAGLSPAMIADRQAHRIVANAPALVR